MQARRAVLAFAIALMLGALVASLAPAPPDPRPQRTPAPTPAAPTPPAKKTSEIAFDAGAERPRVRTVRSGSRLLVTVEVPEPGDVSVEGLGLLAPADSTTPATFDLLLDRPGRFDVNFAPTGAEARRAGTIAVER